MALETCRKLEVYRRAHELALRVHRMSLTLPSFERYEEASQIRRSSKSVSVNIVEGHSNRRYKSLYLSYLYRSLGSCDETQEHLLYLRETGSLKDERLGVELSAEYEGLSKQLFRFIEGVERLHVTSRASEPEPEPPVDVDPDDLAARQLNRRRPQSAIRHPKPNTETRNGT